MQTPVQRFACTRCGRCCDRSPELLLAETSALADMFVFQLMFRLYWLPQQPGDLCTLGMPPEGSAEFFQRKRLLTAHCARRYPAQLRGDGKAVAGTKYLMVSALTLQTASGRCSALSGSDCGIYTRRPVSCRSVPFHYARPEASAVAALPGFTATAGYRCDTSGAAPVVTQGSRIVAADALAARAEASALAGADRAWCEAIVRHMGGASPHAASLPTLETIEANAQHGAMITSMRIGWQIAAEIGLMTAAECRRLVTQQLGLVEAALADTDASPEARDTLREMRSEYRQYLEPRHAIAAQV